MHFSATHLLGGFYGQKKAPIGSGGRGRGEVGRGTQLMHCVCCLTEDSELTLVIQKRTLSNVMMLIIQYYMRMLSYLADLLYCVLCLRV